MDDNLLLPKDLFANIGICRKIRKLGKLGRIQLDESEHRSRLNKHLFDYIEYAGMEVLQFIKMYLTNLQPYMIERKNDQEYDDHIVCIIDKLYRVSLYIKISAKQFEEVIVSFHENHKRGVAKTNDVIKYSSNKYVPVFADAENAHIPDSDKYGIKIFVQRGLKVYPIELIAKKYSEDFFSIDIWEEIVRYVNFTYTNE